MQQSFMHFTLIFLRKPEYCHKISILIPKNQSEAKFQNFTKAFQSHPLMTNSKEFQSNRQSVKNFVRIQNFCRWLFQSAISPISYLWGLSQR